MIGKLLVRGMLVGLVAAILAFGFLKIAGEPSVDLAIGFEGAMEESKAKDKSSQAVSHRLPVSSEQAEPELVSRSVQAGVGLLTGVAVYSAAFGGLFALAFALAYRRMGDFNPRATSALLALVGFVSVYFVPMLKYPANPPSVGLPETIDMRTNLYFAMILVSLAAMTAAGALRRRLNGGFGEWNSALIAVAAYGVVMIGVAFALPSVNEVPEGFPAAVLWQFRLASIGGQVILWATLGLLFGILADKVIAEHSPALRRSAA